MSPKLSCHLSVKTQLQGSIKTKTAYSNLTYMYTSHMIKNSGLSFWEFPVESTVNCIFKKDDNHIEYTTNIWKCLTRNFLSSWFSSQNWQNFSLNSLQIRNFSNNNFWILQETTPGDLHSIHTCSKVPEFLV